MNFLGLARVRLGAAITAILAAILATVVSAIPAAAQSTPPAVTELAQRYAPVVVIREQVAECGEGEPYAPVSVASVFGDPQVVLRGPDGEVIRTAPTAADIAGLGEGYYLDFPGNPLNPGCDFEKWFAAKDAQPTLYARVATDPEHPDDLVLQYWFFWVFNDWNDRHEGDWEMVQIRFPATSAEEALTATPISVAFAQHEGSEVSDWDDPKLRRDGDRIAVYPGQGSHAAYFTQATWFGKSAAAGFGCDNTAGPSVELRPDIVVLPDEPSGDFGWLTFTGRWGEKAPSFNNGPTGPNTKDQWTQPVTWQLDEGRSTAVAIPQPGGAAADAFCTLTRQGSMLFIALLDRPWKVVLALGLLIAGIVAAVKSTAWAGSSLRPLEQARAAGQVASSGLRWWRDQPQFALPASAALVGSSALVLGVQQALLRPRDVVDSLVKQDAPAGWLVAVIVAVSALLLFAVLSFLYSAVIHAVAMDHGGERPSVAEAFKRTATRPATWLIVAVSLLVGGFLLASVILIVVLLYLVSRWAVAAPAAAFEELSPKRAFARSDNLSAGERRHVIGVMVILLALVLVPTALIGALLLLLTPLPFWLTNLLTGAVAAMLLTAAFAGLALLFLDLRARATQPVRADEPTAVR